MRPTSLFFVCSLVTLCLFLNANALITETSDIHAAFGHHADDTLYVFDLDNTLIETAQHLGSDQWFSHKLEHLTKQGISMDDALKQFVPCYLEVMARSQMRLVDPAIPDLLHQMQKKQVPMIGLTKRAPVLAARTLEQLAPLRIDFNHTAHFDERIVFEELNRTEYRDGIIFIAEGIDKGPALLAYLKKLEKMPGRIVVIDDKMSHVQNIADAIEPLGIHFVGIRYGGADENVKKFNPKIAEMQLEHFHRILSDEQALHLMQLGT